MPLLSARRAAIDPQAGSGALRVAIADALQRLPPRPILLDACAAHFASQGNARTDEALCLRAFLKLRQALLEGAPRSQELQLLWRQAVATGHYAARLATELQFDVRDVAIAGLLHQAGEMRVLAAITRAETGCGEKLQESARASLRAQHSLAAVARLLSAWAIAPTAAADVTAWRSAVNNPRPACSAAVVRAAHLLAVSHAAPAHAPPGLAEAARAGLALDPSLVSVAEAQGGALTRLLERVA